ncbi:MAG: hypothetical protein GX416_10275 [Bacteroidales bacterium]|nr:hypothetical protein [Bacteroidales bacterium]
MNVSLCEQLMGTINYSRYHTPVSKEKWRLYHWANIESDNDEVLKSMQGV